MRETKAAERRGKAGNFSLEVPGKDFKGLVEQVRRPQCEGPAWRKALDEQRPGVSPARSVTCKQRRPAGEQAWEGIDRRQPPMGLFTRPRVYSM